MDLAILHDNEHNDMSRRHGYTRSTFQTPDMAAQNTLLNEAAGLVEAGVIKGR